MKNIILIRHAKSSWEQPEIDSKRDLTTKGMLKATKVASFTKKMQIQMHLCGRVLQKERTKPQLFF